MADAKEKNIHGYEKLTLGQLLWIGSEGLRSLGNGNRAEQSEEGLCLTD